MPRYIQLTSPANPKAINVPPRFFEGTRCLRVQTSQRDWIVAEIVDCCLERAVRLRGDELISEVVLDTD